MGGVSSSLHAEQLTALAGVVLSLLFSYVPGLREWFDRLGDRDGRGGTYKRLVMLGLLALTSLGVFGLNCAGAFADLGIDPLAVCSWQGAVQLAWIFVLAVMANQAANQITPNA